MYSGYTFEFMKQRTDPAYTQLYNEVQSIRESVEGLKKDMKMFFDIIEIMRKEGDYRSKISELDSGSQKLLSKKIDMVEQTVDENETVTQRLTERVYNLENKLNNIIDNLGDSSDDDIGDEDDDIGDEDDDGEPVNVNENDDEDEYEDEEEEPEPAPPIKKRPTSRVQNNSNIKPKHCIECGVDMTNEIDNDLNDAMIKMVSNMFMSKLNENTPENRTNIEDSDDDYDENESIYVNENDDKTNIQTDFRVETIDDLIKLGEKYSAMQIKNDKKSNKKKAKKQNKPIQTMPKQKFLFFQGPFQTPFQVPLQAQGLPVINAVTVEEADEASTADTNSGVYEFNGQKYSINIKTLVDLVKPLKKLNRMVGMQKVKGSLLDMILYYLQGFEKKNSNMLHTVIEGPPGVGKTRLGKIMAEIYSAMGIIPSNKFKLVKRTDLIGKYVGHTAHKTQSVIDEAEGGVLFIDEAYGLGADETKDQFSKECIDTLNQNLSENKKKLIVIIAGYGDQLDACFFAYNEGLRRRFPFRFTIEGYDEKEMKDIFLDKIRKMKWKLCRDLDENTLITFFKENKVEFPNFGGDIENLITNCKFSHSRRVLSLAPIMKKKFNKEDLTKGFERFRKYKKEKKDVAYLSMYN